MNFAENHMAGSRVTVSNDGQAPLLEVSGLSHSFGDRTVLDSISFSVNQGEVLALIGPNGAGKSTLLATIAGDLQPQSGTVYLEGSPLKSYKPLPLARKRAVLLQKTSVSFSYTVREIIEMGRTPWLGTDRAAQDESVIQRAMQETETVHMAQRDVMTLSGGESGRVHLARVVAQQAPLLLLDEPTAALDILHQEQTLKNARDYAAAGAAVVVVLHDLDAAAAYADRLILLQHGRIIKEGLPSQVCTAERLSRVYGHPIEVLPHPVSGRLLVLPERGWGS